MKASRRIVFVVLVLAVGGGLFWWQERARRAESNEVLTLYGNVDIRQVELGFRVGGRIVEMGVEEGQAVHEGELLARLDPQPYEDALAQATAELAVQQAGLAKVRAGYRAEDVAQAMAAVQGSRAAMVNAQANLRRVEVLYGRKAVAKKDFDEARSAYIEALSRFKANDEQLGLMQSGYRSEDVQSQEAAVDAASAAQRSAQLNLHDTQLYASSRGVVLTRVREPGAVVQPAQTVYTLTLNHPTWLRAFVSQLNLGNLRPGQAVLVEVDSTPGKRYPGTIGFISPTAEFTPKTVETREVRNDLVFRFRVLVEDTDNIMRQGMPVTIILRKDGGQP